MNFFSWNERYFRMIFKISILYFKGVWKLVFFRMGFELINFSKYKGKFLFFVLVLFYNYIMGKEFVNFFWFIFFIKLFG